MSVVRNQKHLQEYLYDFAVDGGTDDTFIDLSAKAGYAPLPSGAIVTNVGLKVLEAVVGTSSTIIVGNTTDPNGYMEAIAEGTLIDEYVTMAGAQAGALLWDDTNDHLIPFLVNSDNDADFGITIGTADLSAGKVLFWVEYYMPTLD